MKTDEWYVEHSSDFELKTSEKTLKRFLKFTGAKRVK